ncbi:hypothetical protein PARPLA_02802 [Rhodobacteraceae bacterium THAF1]|uniref:hypothetical protein n=1 Tax=Palleronia sp. THAF1 TaxID=2587842 RepID=UPI000F3D28BF|nr:hypothetical protein [Palleronia sp. THAF1]QFU08205.1 hypothetical protein FIU81_05920 [Palleronia sp. THAF1]VDC28759.1 hypothetical protein PARPLA_02802 [Rhodobacteraceae bacterium THAF1]
MTWLMVGLVAAIAGLVVWQALRVMRAEADAERGSLPGSGHHTLRSEYFSGGGGGGNASEYTVPKDPQAYARLFVPKDKSKD